MKITSILLIVAILGFISCEPDENGKDPDNGNDENPSWGSQPPLPSINGESTVSLTGSETYVDVMENFMPRMPNFPTVKAKEGKVIGYVADLSGKPLEGANVGIRSSVIGGTYSSASGQTNEKGYYEILVPWGAAEIYNAGYSITYGTGKAAIGLYPSDGKIQSFESTKGLVKNFVLLTYGFADENIRAERPWSSSGYFGGSIYISYNLADPGDIWASSGSLPYNSEIELKLTPNGETRYGETRTFIIHKKVESLNFTINNIPVGNYNISAKLKDGRQLRLKQIGPNVSLYPHHGLKPKDALGTVQVYFTPMTVDPKMTLPNYGNWRPVDVKLELP